MKLKDLFGKNIDINCYIEIWYRINDEGKLLGKAYGNQYSEFEPWYEMEVVYITTNVGGNGIIIEVA